MQKRRIAEGVHWLGAVDWNRRLFDALMPLPDGTSYNAYLVRGSKMTVLLDTVEPTVVDRLLAQLADVERIDRVVAHHAEQDHSGSIPVVLERYPEAKVVCTPKCREMLGDLLHVPENRFETVEDGEILDIGGRTLEFLHLPWVHWPETMGTWLREEKILFSCDLFGSHFATSDLYAREEARVLEAAKKYYAEIMMPYRKAITKHLARLEGYDIGTIAPSHGPVHDRPAAILDAYRDWAAGEPRNEVLLPFVSMHGSTEKMVLRLIGALADRGVRVRPVDVSVTSVGKLAAEMVDCATIVIGTPVVLGGAHPTAAYAAYLANALKPKARFVSVVGSYGWGGRAIEQIDRLMPSLKLETLEPVVCKGDPDEEALRAVDDLAERIAAKHAEAGLAS
ncbi:MAG: FprA family A-type flavoprotein [Candidatus Eisenbacteria bacterium]|nr:FprA family A-type flavoprotein [Candidatus Eisenbacteria bacterium]